MDPITMALLTTIPSLFKMGTGIAQGIQARKLGKTPRPEYEIPGAATSALDVSKRLAASRELPGQSIMEDKLRTSTASGVEGIKKYTDSPAAAMDYITKLYGGEMGAKNELDIAAAQNYQSNQIGLQGALGDYAKYEDKAFDYNKDAPYQAAMNAAAMLKEGSLQNIFGGLQGATNTMATGMQGKATLGTAGSFGDSGASAIASGLKRKPSSMIKTPAGDIIVDNNFGTKSIEDMSPEEIKAAYVDFLTQIQ